MPSSPGGASRLERNRITPYGKWLRPIPPGVEGNIEIGVRGTHLVTPPTQHTHTADLAKPTFCEPGEEGGLSQWTVGLYACAALCCYLVILRTSLRKEDADGRPSVGAFALPLPIGAGSPAPPPKTQTAASPTPQHAGSTAPLAIRGRQWHKANTILRRQ